MIRRRIPERIGTPYLASSRHMSESIHTHFISPLFSQQIYYILATGKIFVFGDVINVSKAPCKLFKYMSFPMSDKWVPSNRYSSISLARMLGCFITVSFIFYIFIYSTIYSFPYLFNYFSVAFGNMPITPH